MIRNEVIFVINPQEIDNSQYCSKRKMRLMRYIDSMMRFQFYKELFKNVSGSFVRMFNAGSLHSLVVFLGLSIAIF